MRVEPTPPGRPAHPLRWLLIGVGLLLALWGAWGLLTDLPNADAMQSAVAPLTEPAEVAVETQTPTVVPTPGSPEEEATRTAVAIATALSAPSGGGSSGGPSRGPGGGSGGAATAGPTVAPLGRLAEFDYPAQMQVGEPAQVRFSLFSEGDAPIQWRGAFATPQAVTLDAPPDLEVWVIVKLDVLGADARPDTLDQAQLLTNRNSWRWKITTSSAQPVELQPQVLVEYRDRTGLARSRAEIPWPYSYTVDKVIGPGALAGASDWVGLHLFQVIALLFGPMPVVPTLWNSRKRLRQALEKRGILKPSLEDQEVVSARAMAAGPPRSGSAAPGASSGNPPAATTRSTSPPAARSPAGSPPAASASPAPATPPAAPPSAPARDSSSQPFGE